MLRPETDLVIFKDHLCVVLDGWHPLKPLEQKEVEDSDAEDEPEKKPEKKVVEIPKLAIYNCAVCTFENDIGASRCGVCEGPRPPMD